MSQSYRDFVKHEMLSLKSSNLTPQQKLSKVAAAWRAKTGKAKAPKAAKVTRAKKGKGGDINSYLRHNLDLGGDIAGGDVAGGNFWGDVADTLGDIGSTALQFAPLFLGAGVTTTYKGKGKGKPGKKALLKGGSIGKGPRNLSAENNIQNELWSYGYNVPLKIASKYILFFYKYMGPPEG